MPTYRVYYAERDPNEAVSAARYATRMSRLGTTDNRGLSETEWEEEVEAKNATAALEAFFRDHVRERSEVRWVDEKGESREIEGVADYDAEKTYIWVEKNKLMEYQGIDEATPGLVACPLCGGAGEVDPETADEYLAGYEEEGEREGSWG